MVKRVFDIEVRLRVYGHVIWAKCKRKEISAVYLYIKAEVYTHIAKRSDFI